MRVKSSKVLSLIILGCLFSFIMFNGCASFDLNAFKANESTTSSIPLDLDLENTFDFETSHEFYWETIEVKLATNKVKNLRDHYVQYYKEHSELFAGEEIFIAENGERAEFLEQMDKASNDKARQHDLIVGMSDKICHLGSTLNFEYYFDTNIATSEFILKLGRVRMSDSLSAESSSSAPMKIFVADQLNAILANPEAETLGTLKLNVESFDECRSWLFYPLTALTVGTIGAFRVACFPLGIPYFLPETQLKLTATITDKRGNEVVRYSIKSAAKAYSAWYWGYFSGADSRNAANAKAWQMAIDDLVGKINRDTQMINLRCK